MNTMRLWTYFPLCQHMNLCIEKQICSENEQQKENVLQYDIYTKQIANFRMMLEELPLTKVVCMKIMGTVNHCGRTVPVSERI